MGQLGFFDADNRLAALSAKGDPLEEIDRLVPWESFRGDSEAAVLTPETDRKSTAGRKPIDVIMGTSKNSMPLGPVRVCCPDGMILARIIHPIDSPVAQTCVLA